MTVAVTRRKTSRFVMHHSHARWMRTGGACLSILAAFLLVSCRGHGDDRSAVVMVIESSPNNLDLRQGTDAQSERIGGLIFDALVRKDEHYVLQPWLATRWEQPDILTWVIHLRDAVHFQDGRPLEAEDVAWTIRSMIDGSLMTAKAGAFAAVERVETPDKLTVVVHLKRPDPGLLFNMSDGLFGVVPRGAGKDFGLHPVGSGPFRFVSAVQDKEVVVKRNQNYWVDDLDSLPGDTPQKDKTPGGAGGHRIERLRFAVVPDAITAALEMKKGSADLETNVIPVDMAYALRKSPNLVSEMGASSVVIYANFNVLDPVLKDKRVRQAIACAIDRQAIIQALWRGQARVANTLLPIGHWAAASDDQLPLYPHDVERAKTLLEAAGFHAGKDGIRLRITLKTSTDETTRLLAAVLQQQMRVAGIDLQIRSAEFGTFYADVIRGAFQMYALRWIGSNEDPDIFRYAYDSASFPPKGGNRGRYTNPQVDALLRQAAGSTNQEERRRLYIEVQQILADDVPVIPLWYPNNEVIHSRRTSGVTPHANGNFDFLRTATVR